MDNQIQVTKMETLIKIIMMLFLLMSLLFINLSEAAAVLISMLCAAYIVWIKCDVSYYLQKRKEKKDKLKKKSTQEK